MKAIGSLLLGFVIILFWLLTMTQPRESYAANSELRAQELVRAVPGLALSNQTETPTYVPTDTPTPTETPTDVPTNTPTLTQTPTEVPTDTPTWTATPTDVPTNTPTLTQTPTEVPTNTPTPTATLTVTPTNTSTPTNTPTPTYLPGVHLTHGPVVGAVTESSAHIFARTDDRASVKIRYSLYPDLDNAAESVVQETCADHDFTTIIPLSHLSANTLYYIDIIINEKPQLQMPYPRFKTFPPANSQQRFRFVHLTDSSIVANVASGAFTHAAQAEPDFVILGGDFPHGNPQTLSQRRNFYKKLYDPITSPSISDFVSLILRRYPIAHMWDDHDYGLNNGDKTYPLKAMSFQALQEYYPLYEVTAYGDWQKFSYAQADFFLLDSRSQRDPNKIPDGPSKSMLDGDNLRSRGQLVWLKQGLRNSNAKWKFILSPVAFNRTTKPLDAWANFGNERTKLIRFITRHNINGIIFISGDLHAGGIDNGQNSDFPEMVNNPANGPGCVSGIVGNWSQGSYGQQDISCNGYGVITVLTNPDRVRLEVKDEKGRTRIRYTVKQ